MSKTVGTAQDPNLILRIDGNIRPKSHPPLGRDLWEIGVPLELGQAAFSEMRRLRRGALSQYRSGKMREHPKQNDSSQNGSKQTDELHGLSPQCSLQKKYSTAIG